MERAVDGRLRLGGWPYRDPCAYCGEYKRGQMTRDHILPKAHGGRNGWENITAACNNCNRKRGHRPLLIYLLSRGLSKKQQKARGLWHTNNPEKQHANQNLCNSDGQSGCTQSNDTPSLHPRACGTDPTAGVEQTLCPSSNVSPMV